MNKDHKTQQLSDTIVCGPLQSTSELDDSNLRWPSKSEMSGSAGPADVDDNEDLIEDGYDSYDDLFTQHFTDEKLSQLDGTKVVPQPQDRPLSPAPVRNAKSQQKPASNSKRFFLQSAPPSNNELLNPTLSQKEALPWAQRYAPLNLDELAVHKRKVGDVEQWLSDALAGKVQRNLLVLKGPAGSGKTTTISLLSKKLNFNILEWKSPSKSPYASKDYVSLGVQFDGFLSRGHIFGSLDLDGHHSLQVPMKNNHATQRRVILIEEFPTMAGRNATVLAAFRLSILRYLSMNAPPSRNAYGREVGIPPIVMIVSETFLSSESPFNNLTAHRLLGRELYNHPRTTIIEFNSIAPTFMHKALNLVLKKSSRQPCGNHALTQSMIENISKLGDIRNAIASLEFLCLGSGNRSYWSDPTVKTRRTTRTRKKNSAVESEVREIAQRETSLGLFHAVGKIIYNKRSDASDAEHVQLPSPPDHLRDLDRPRVSLVHVNELLDETGTDIQSFIGTLHENYVPSCNGPSFTECLEGCIGFLSDSDMLCCDRNGHNKSQAGVGIGSVRLGTDGVDELRQEEISYHVAARGLLFALPYPVKRPLSYTGNTKRTNDSHKVFFPPVIRLVRQLEEINNHIDSWKDTLLGSTVRPTAVPVSGPTFCKFIRAKEKNPLGEHDEDSPSLVAMISRSDLILHQLPYMTKIVGKGTISENLQQITSFRVRGPDFSSQHDEEYALRSSFCEVRDLKPKREKGIGLSGPQTLLVSQADDERLILSDDDILDDL
ncbi:Rad17 cell cycle checkpoint protein-domain-containing protein [Aspergillus recurvatus]